jgi:hypothetical protein
MRLYSTVCFRSWPRHYVTYYQETQAPYRRCDRAHVFRFLTFGLVLVPHWTTKAADEDDALMYGLGARVLPWEEGLQEDIHSSFSGEPYVSKRRHQEL